MNQSANNNSSVNRRILKAFGLFGGVQSLTILFSVVRTKFVSVLLGGTGVGLFGIFNSALELMVAVSQLNVQDSAVRNLAAASTPQEKSRTALVVRRWTLFLGIVGALLMIGFAPLFREYTFENREYTYAYRMLGIVVLFTTVTQGYIAIMRGLEYFSNLAKAQVYGAAGGLVVSVPMYYYLGLQSIIPSFIAFGFFTLLAAWLMRPKLEPVLPRPTLAQTVKEGGSFIRLGFFMTVSSVAALASSYIFMAWLNEHANTFVVGQFNAGFTIVNRYVGVIIGVIGIEYFPRLSKLVAKGESVQESVRTEINLGLQLLLPCVCLFVAMSPLIVDILYSREFDPIVGMVNWAIIGTLFRLHSWSLAFVILAKGDGKIYVVTEVISAIVYVLAGTYCYDAFGLTGLGYAYLIWFVLYDVSTWIVFRYRYHMTLGVRSWLITAGSVICITAVVVLRDTTLTFYPALLAAALTGWMALKKIRGIFKN